VKIKPQRQNINGTKPGNTDQNKYNKRERSSEEDWGENFMNHSKMWWRKECGDQDKCSNPENHDLSLTENWKVSIEKIGGTGS